MFTCMLIVAFLFLYISGLLANRRQLADLPEALPIPARISNLNGTLSQGMMIKESVIQGFENSEYVADLDYTAETAAALTEIPEEQAEDMDRKSLTFPSCIGVNRLDAVTDLTEDEISFAAGCGPESLEGDEPVCLIGEREMEERKLSPGDSIRMTLFSISYPNDNAAMSRKWLGVYEVKIAGSFKNDYQEEPDRTVQAIFPVKWLQKLHTQAGIMFFADSAHFTVANPMELNTFKSQMKKLGLLQVISEADYSQRGNALTVYDETFIKTATRLKDNIALMQLLMPLIIGIVGLLGFVVSYLLLQSRRPEIAIMRSLGLSRWSCFRILFLENAVLELTGSLAGVILSILLIQVSAGLACAVAVPFFVVYMTGTSVALILLGRFSVMQVLTALD